MIKRIKFLLTNWVINSVLKGFTFDEVFEGLGQEEKDKLAMKAKDYLSDEFWTKFDKHIDNIALNKMGRGSVSADEMMFAKMVLWFNETRRTKLKEITNWKKPDYAPEPKKW